MQKHDDITQLKDKYIRYYEDVPVQKYAAMYIGRTEQTVISWCKSDIDFFNRVQVAKANWIKKKFIKTKAEFQLEKLEKEVFGKNSVLEVNKPIPIINLVKYSDEKKSVKKLDQKNKICNIRFKG